MIGILNYSAGKFDFQGQVNYAKYVVNQFDQNIGMDITPPFIAPGYTQLATNINYVGQEINAHLRYAEGTISYLVNPRYNLRLELGVLYRDESSSLGDQKTTLFTFGLRSTFRSLYHDF